MVNQGISIVKLNEILEENFAAGVSEIEKELSYISFEDLFKPFTI